VRRMTSEEFLTRAKEVHSSRYTYDHTVYVNSTTSVVITCKTHGNINILPSTHLSGAGCRHCYYDRLSKKFRYDTPTFITKAKAVHGDLYDYSMVRYERSGKKVDIVCPIHGVFSQIPASHLAGFGCRRCGFQKQLDTKIKDGQITSPTERKPFEEYRRKVRELSNINYIKYYHDINSTGLPRGNEYHLDHITSIMSGFIQNIPPEDIAAPQNLRVIPAVDNQRKGVISCDAISSFDENNVLTNPLDDLALYHKRIKQSNRYRITDLVTHETYDIPSITDWCSVNGYAVSSARWMANYSTAPFKGRYLIKKL